METSEEWKMILYSFNMF